MTSQPKHSESYVMSYFCTVQGVRVNWNSNLNKNKTEQLFRYN